jgi:hypothetical protein
MMIMQAFQLHGHLYALYVLLLAYFGDTFFSHFSIIWGHSAVTRDDEVSLNFSGF